MKINIKSIIKYILVNDVRKNKKNTALKPMLYLS